MIKVLYFSTPTCGPCRVFYPILSEYLEQKGVEMDKIDMSETCNSVYKEEYGLASVPTVVVLEDGKVKGKVVGTKLTEVKELV